jgi:hypothetical protein
MKKLLLFLAVFAAYASNAATLYWVNGTGNWSDSTHWSNTSGGSSCGCVPTLNDNVFFDANSFTGFASQVTVNTTAYCKDMNWTGAANSPQLSGTSAIHINGSLTLISGINISNYTGSVYFESQNAGQTVTSAGKQFHSIIYFDNGEYILQDAFNTTAALYLDKGQLNFNSQNVTAYFFYSYNSNIRSLILGNSAITITGYYYNNYNYSWYCSSTNFTVSTGNSVITFTYANSVYFRGGSQPYYNLVFNNGSTNIGYIYDGSNTFNNVTFNGSGSVNSGNSTFNKVSFVGDGTISGGNNSADSVIFSAGKTYTLGSGNTLTIGSYLQANGGCSNWIDLKSSTPGTQASINKTSGSVTVSYVRMRDINGLNGTFTDNNAWDMGNNSGWTMNLITPRNMYWINNGGNWDNSTHWSLTSGGASSGCIPTIYDNVFFDANSFTGLAQVTVNTTAYCKNMSWTGAANTPQLSGTSALHINGSLTFIPGMNITTFTGGVYFESQNAGQTVTSAGKQFHSIIYFDNGEYILQDAFNTTAALYLDKGQLNFNSQNVTAYFFYSYNSNIRSLILGNSAITITGYYYNNYNYSWYCSPTNFTVSTGSSSITSTYASSVYFRGGSQPYYNLVFNNGSANIGYIYDGSNTFNNVTFNGSGSVNSGNSTFNKVSFVGDGTISGSNNSADSVIFSAGKTYTLGSGNTLTIGSYLQAVGNSASYITIQSSSVGSQAFIHKSIGNICGEYLKLKDINAGGGADFFAGSNSVDLGDNTGWFWCSCSSAPPTITLNGSILHSNTTSGNQWYNQTGLLNGATSQDYTPTANGNYYVIVSNNGCSSDTSNVITITTVGINVISFFNDISIYPNPANDNITIENTSLNNNKDAMISIYKIQGQLLLQQPMLQTKININVSALPVGMYYIEMRTEKGIEVRKFVKE